MIWLDLAEDPEGDEELWLGTDVLLALGIGPED